MAPLARNHQGVEPVQVIGVQITALELAPADSRNMQELDKGDAVRIFLSKADAGEIQVIAPAVPPITRE